MKHPIQFATACICICLFMNCKKKDEIVRQSVSGIVINKTTDKGEAGQVVTLEIYNDNELHQSLTASCGADGQFKFNDVEFHSDSKYQYALIIKSTRITTPHTIGFEGVSVLFNKEDASTFFNLNIVPYLKALRYRLNTMAIIQSPDSFNISYEQPVYNKNFPGNAISGRFTNNTTNFYPTISQKPMGWYKIQYKKWKAGVYSEVADSIFCGFGSDNTYLINW